MTTTMRIYTTRILENRFVKFMMEDEEESTTDNINVTSDAFSHASSSLRENTDVIFTSDNLDKLNELVEAINNLKINNAGYELKIATTSDAKGDITSNPYTVTHTINDPDTVNHTSNRILDEKLLSSGPSEKSLPCPCQKN